MKPAHTISRHEDGNLYMQFGIHQNDAPNVIYSIHTNISPEDMAKITALQEDSKQRMNRILEKYTLQAT